MAIGMRIFGGCQAPPDAGQQLAEVIEHDRVMDPSGIRLLFDRLLAPVFEYLIDVLLDELTNFNMRLGSNDLRVKGHEKAPLVDAQNKFSCKNRTKSSSSSVGKKKKGIPLRRSTERDDVPRFLGAAMPKERNLAAQLTLTEQRKL